MATKPRHCTNCGQEVSGAVARDAHDEAVAYCWKCGSRLEDDGTCPTRGDCRYGGQVSPPPPKAPRARTFCGNCGQTVSGKAAKAAHNPEVTHCWKCGAKLDAAGRCPNDDCAFFEQVPPRPPTPK